MIVTSDELPNFLNTLPTGLSYSALVEIDGFRVPFSISRSTNHNILTTYHESSYVKANIQNGDMVAGAEWTQQLPGAVIILADPTRSTHPDVNYGWGQTPLDQVFFPKMAARLSATVGGILGLNKRVHAGCSEGSFVAIASSLFDEGSYAWVNNAQLDWSLLPETSSASKICESLGFSDLESFASSYAWRVSIPALQKRLRSTIRLHHEVSDNYLRSPFGELSQMHLNELEGEVTQNQYSATTKTGLLTATDLGDRIASFLLSL